MELGQSVARTIGMETTPWSIVLAAGEGSRLSSAIKNWFGRECPKQFCALGGSQTMVEKTISRALDVSSLNQVLTIVGKSQLSFIPPHAKLGRVIKQPRNLGTGIGILYSLAHILPRNPEAIVSILPSDHFVAPKRVFSKFLRLAVRFVKDNPQNPLLLAAQATSPETDYGWIETGNSINDSSILSVSRFREKPPMEEASRLWNRGALWNTMITVSKAKTLWELARAVKPDLIRHFEEIFSSLDSGISEEEAENFYQRIAPLDFSKDILEVNAHQINVLPMRGVVWSDWGRPERILEIIGQFGLPSPMSTGGSYELNRTFRERPRRVKSFA